MDFKQTLKYIQFSLILMPSYRISLCIITVINKTDINVIIITNYLRNSYSNDQLHSIKKTLFLKFIKNINKTSE